jgi:hypothetical protein
LKSARHLLDPKGASTSIVYPIQRPNQCTCFGAVRQARQLCQFSASHGLQGEKKYGFQFSKPFITGVRATTNSGVFRSAYIPWTGLIIPHTDV